MDDIVNFFNSFSNKYPKSWLNVEEYVTSLLPNDNNDSLNFKSNYIKRHICRFNQKNIEFIPKNKAKTIDIKSSIEIFELDLIDYEDVFRNFDENYFDIEEWATERLEFEINSIREFLFDCSLFKGVFFIHTLNKELQEIENNLNSLWDRIEPNWLQKEIVNELKRNLNYLKESVIEDFSMLYPEMINIFNNNYNKKKKTETKSISLIWYKIANLMAKGIIEIGNRGEYIFSGKTIKKESEVCELVSKHFNDGTKPNSIKFYLSRTKAEIMDNKNIFIPKRIDELKALAINAEKEGVLSSYFKTKLKKLIDGIE